MTTSSTKLGKRKSQRILDHEKCGYTAQTTGSVTVWKGAAGSERDYRDTV